MFPHKKIRPLGYLLLTMMLGISVIGCRYPECPDFISNNGINGLIQIRAPSGLNVYGQLQYLHNSGIVQGGPNRVYIITAWAPSILDDHDPPYDNEDIPGINPGITFVPNNPTEYVHVIIESDNPSFRRDIQLISAGTMFEIGPRNILYLYNVALVGMPVTLNTNNPMVNVSTEGTLRMKDNSAITGNLGGRGVRVDGGTFYMYDTASITGNTDGGVLVTGSTGTFTMSGGLISVNTATSGGGVHVSGVGTSFTMSGGVIGGDFVDLNTAVVGGGVMISGGAEFVMEGGTISFNEATNAGTNEGGGGVHLTGAGSSFILDGGIITWNVAGAAGGGVDMQANTTFIMIDGEISANEATSAAAFAGGGGVHLVGALSEFRMYGGTISGNWAQRGGGVRVNGGDTYPSHSRFYMHGGTITANTAGADGGGVDASSHSRFEMHGGTIGPVNNAPQGGGVSLNLPLGIWPNPPTHPNINFTMTGGTISGNTATNHGGGVWLSAASRFRIYGPGMYTGGANTGGLVHGRPLNMSPLFPPPPPPMPPSSAAVWNSSGANSSVTINGVTTSGSLLGSFDWTIP